MSVFILGFICFNLNVLDFDSFVFFWKILLKIINLYSGNPVSTNHTIIKRTSNRYKF